MGQVKTVIHIKKYNNNNHRKNLPQPAPQRMMRFSVQMKADLATRTDLQMPGTVNCKRILAAKKYKHIS